MVNLIHTNVPLSYGFPLKIIGEFFHLTCPKAKIKRCNVQHFDATLTSDVIFLDKAYPVVHLLAKNLGTE